MVRYPFFHVFLLAIIFIPTNLPPLLLIAWSNFSTVLSFQRVRKLSFLPVKLYPLSIATVILNRLQYMSGTRWTLFRITIFVDPSFWRTSPLNLPTFKILSIFLLPTFITPDPGQRSYIPWIKFFMWHDSPVSPIHMFDVNLSFTSSPFSVYPSSTLSSRAMNMEQFNFKIDGMLLRMKCSILYDLKY